MTLTPHRTPREKAAQASAAAAIARAQARARPPEPPPAVDPDDPHAQWLADMPITPAIARIMRLAAEEDLRHA